MLYFVHSLEIDSEQLKKVIIVSAYQIEELKKELAGQGLRIASQSESGWYYRRTGVWVTEI